MKHKALDKTQQTATRRLASNSNSKSSGLLLPGRRLLLLLAFAADHTSRSNSPRDTGGAAGDTGNHLHLRRGYTRAGRCRRSDRQRR